MKKVSESDFIAYVSWAKENTSNTVYPLSIAEGFQTGDIYLDNDDNPRAVLFWHYCVFGHISGTASDVFLRELHSMMLSRHLSRRIVLISNDEEILRFFRNQGFQLTPRFEYSHPCTLPNTIPFHADRFRIKPIDRNILSGIEGRIVPSFSWDSNDRFLKRGFGYAALEGETVCAVAFSSAISSFEIDIGVETREAYRKNGLAAAVAGKMCEQIIQMGKAPVWAHGAANLGSMHTALKCGFVKTKVTTLIKKPE